MKHERKRKQIVTTLLLTFLVFAFFTQFIKFPYMPIVKATDFFTDDFERAALAGSYETVVTAVTSTDQAKNGEYSARVKGDEYFMARENTTDESVNKYVSGWVYVATCTPSANWWQDIYQVRSGGGDLMGYCVVHSPDSGTHFYYRVRWFNMSDYSDISSTGTVEVDQNAWHFWILQYNYTGSGVGLYFYVDDVLVDYIEVETDQTYNCDGICIGGQKTGGFSSYEYVDGLQFTSSYPSDPFEAPAGTTPTITDNPLVNATRAGNMTSFHASFDCPVGLSGGYLESNTTGSTANSTFVSFGDALIIDAIFNRTLPSDAGDVVEYRFFVNSTDGGWLTTDTYTLETTNAKPSLLYVDGTEIKFTENDTVVILKGVNYYTMVSDLDVPVSVWEGRGDTQYEDIWVTNTSKIHENLDAMKIWGANYVRIHYSAESWLTNSTYRDLFIEAVDYAFDLGIFVSVDGYYGANGDAFTGIPYLPDGGNLTGLLDTQQDFINMLVNITETLDFDGNFLPEGWNEPQAPIAEWQNVSNYACSAIRSVSDAPFIYQWYYGPDGVHDCTWMRDYPIIGTINNIIYSTHIYKNHIDNQITVANINASLVASGVWNATHQWNRCLLIGEWGLNSYYTGSDWVDEQTRFKNFVSLCDDYGWSHAEWAWMCSPSQYTCFGNPTAYDVGLYTEFIPHAGEAGQILVNSMNANPFLWSAGSESYIYSNDASAMATWSDNQLTVTYSGLAYVNVWWNVSSSYLVNSTLKIANYNDTIYDALDYYDSDTNLISIYGGTAWKFGYDLTEYEYTPPSDSEAPTYSNVGHDNTLAAYTANLYSYWNDNVELDSYIFSSNNTGLWVNGTLTAFSTTPSWANVSLTLNATVGAYVYYKWYAYDTSGNWATTTTQYLVTTETEVFLDTEAPTFGEVTASNTVAGSTVTLSVDIFDNIAVSNYIFCWNNTGMWVNQTIQSFPGTGNPAVFTGTWSVVNGSVVSVKVYAYDTSNNGDVSGIYNFTLTGASYPLVSGVTVLYMRSDTYTVFNTTYYGLDTTNTASSATVTQTDAIDTVYFGFRVFLLNEAGSTREITAGTPVAQMYRSSNGYGVQLGLYSMGSVRLTAGATALLVKVYSKVGTTGTWVSRVSFVSSPLLADAIEESTWTFSLYTNKTGETVSISFGSGSAESKISGLSFSEPDLWGMAMYYFHGGDYAMFFLYPYTRLIGMSPFVSIIMFGIGLTVYVRFRSFVFLLLVLVALSIGGVLQFIMGDALMGVVALICTFALAALYWKVFR